MENRGIGGEKGRGEVRKCIGKGEVRKCIWKAKKEQNKKKEVKKRIRREGKKSET